MKSLLILIAFFSLSAQASRLPESRQLAIVQDIAKAERRELYRTGHTDVSSHVGKMDRTKLNVLIKENDRNEQPLNRDEISQLYRCVNSPKNCSLYLISTMGTYMSGSGEGRTYVLLDPNNGKSELIRHVTYAE